MSSSPPSIPSMEVSRKEVEAAFSLCDSDHPDRLKITELKLVMRGLGFDPRNAQIESMTKKIKANKEKSITGREDPDHIDVDEFLALLKESFDSDKSEEEMRGAFRLFDREGKGWITVENLKQVAKELGEDISLEELHEMIGEAEGAGPVRGRVDEKAFFEIMKKTCLY